MVASRAQPDGPLLGHGPSTHEPKEKEKEKESESEGTAATPPQAATPPPIADNSFSPIEFDPRKLEDGVLSIQQQQQQQRQHELMLHPVYPDSASPYTPFPGFRHHHHHHHHHGHHHDREVGDGYDPQNPRGGARRLIRLEGESGRRGVHPLHFFRILFRSSSKVSQWVNVLWPVVPVALVVRYSAGDHHIAAFTLAYIAMVPCANLIGFAGQELARKVPHVMGVMTETMLGGIVEIILFIVMVRNYSETEVERGGVDYTQVVKAAMLGSLLATMLFCMGLCFVAGGFKKAEQEFSDAVSEAGTGLLLVAGFGLAIPTVFEKSLPSSSLLSAAAIKDRAIQISRSTAILLMFAYMLYIYFQTRSHNIIYTEVFEEEEAEHRRRRGNRPVREKLTLTECVVALLFSVTLVTIIAISLVEQIPAVVERGVSDAFVGLILVPFVEKAAEGLTAINEAWNSQMNFAMSHVLGATLQTALFNGPLAVMVGWGLGKPMGLDFEIFDITVLILAILAVGNFLRDQKTNYLEGSLCVIIYIAIAFAVWYYPELNNSTDTSSSTPSSNTTAAHALVQAVATTGAALLDKR